MSLCLFILYSWLSFSSSLIRNKHNSLKNSYSIRSRLFSNIQSSIETLENFDADYRNRINQIQKDGLNPQLLEFYRVQELKAIQIQEERRNLKTACLEVSLDSESVVLGIMGNTGVDAIDTLRRWVSGLSLSRGLLKAFNDINVEVDYELLNDFPVYIKYNSSDSGNAYMKQYNGKFTGVIFQPKLRNDDTFRQYGNIPLNVF